MQSTLGAAFIEGWGFSHNTWAYLGIPGWTAFRPSIGITWLVGDPPPLFFFLRLKFCL